MLATEKKNSSPLPLAPFRAVGQSFHHLFPNKQLEEKGNFSPREQAAALAMIGIDKNDYLQGQQITHSKKSIATRLGNLFLQVANNLIPKRPLPGEFVTALGETDEGQRWTKEDQAAKLKAILQEAFADGKKPEPISREANLVKVIKVGNTEIKIISPGIVGLKEHRNYKISAPVKGQELKATVDSKNNQDLFQQLWDFDLKHDQLFQTPEILSTEELNEVLTKGTIVNAILLNREISPDDGTPTDTVELHLKHNDKLQFFAMKYTGHTKENPYDVHCILDIRDGTSRNFNAVQLDASTASLRDAAEELIKTKLKAFNDEYLISYS